MGYDYDIIDTVILIQNWWRYILEVTYRCRKEECGKLIPHSKGYGQLCNECYTLRYHPEFGWDRIIN